MPDTAMAQPEDYITARRDALRSAYAGEIEALKRRGRRRRLSRAVLALTLLLGLGVGIERFAFREVTAGTAPHVVDLAGGRLFLDAGARAELPLSPWRREIRLTAGEAVFDIVHDEGRPFVVRSGRIVLTDLGTRFLVRHSPSETLTAVFEGRVEASAPGDIRGILEAGQAAVISAEGLTVAGMPDEAEATAWRQGRMVLRNTRLDEAARRISRYRDRPVRADHPAVAGLRVSGSFSLDDPDGALRTLAQGLTLRLQEDGAATLLLPRR